MVAFQLDIVEILFHGPHMIACCALGNDAAAAATPRCRSAHAGDRSAFLLWSMVEIIYAGKHRIKHQVGQ